MLVGAAAIWGGSFVVLKGAVDVVPAPWLLGIRFWRIGAPVLVMFGLALPCYVALLLLNGVFDKLEGKDPSREDESDDTKSSEDEA